MTAEQYQGNFENGSINGYGVFTSSEEQYSGEFRNGERDGEGELRFKNGSSYTGSFKRGCFDGTFRYNKATEKWCIRTATSTRASS